MDVPRLVGAVQRVADHASTADELLEGVSAEVRTAVPYDGSMWFGLDPSTLLAVGPGRMEGLDDGYCQGFWHGEFHEHDVNLFVDLARTTEPAAALREVTDDRPLRSSRYRAFIRPQGFDDELRAVFRVGRSTWGATALFRQKGRGFTRDEVSAVQAVSGIVAKAIRGKATAASPASHLAHSPGLLIFTGAGALVSANTEATQWLEDIYGVDPDNGWMQRLSGATERDLDIAVPLIPLVARARAVSAGLANGPARLRLRDRSGRWVVLHASVLGGSGGQPSGENVAVVVEPAKSAEIAPIIIEAYGLTPRERDVVRAIARGSSTPEMAAELFLSTHTVRDHIKSVFDKIGVSSRAELVAKLFGEHYSDPFHATLVHGD